MAGYNYRRSTAHGVQDLHRGEDVVPTGPDSGANARYPKGVIGMPIHLISRAKILAVWDRDSVGGYHQAVLVSMPLLDMDVLFGHILAGHVPSVGDELDVWDVVAKMGNRYDADPTATTGRGGNVDAHVHVQCALSRDRKESMKLGTAFNNVAIDPRKVRIAAGEPDLPRVPYYGPNGPVQSSEIMAATPFEEPNLLCGDHA